MVTAVCHRVLRDRHAAEDATQAAFMALARKASSVRENPAGWLFRVARRIAVKMASRRVVLPTASTSVTPAVNDDVEVLHDELARLPDKYRLPVLLCFFEGLSHADAARRLGWPAGTVAGRIARAKDTLHARLTRRGVAVPAAGLSALCVATDVSGTFATTTTRAAIAFVSGTAINGFPEHILLHAKGAIRAMTIAKLQTAAGILLTCAALTAGSVWAYGQGIGIGAAPASAGAQLAAPPVAAKKPDWWLIVEGPEDRRALRPCDGGILEALPAVKRIDELSPDGKKRLYVDADPKSAHFGQLTVERTGPLPNEQNRFQIITTTIQVAKGLSAREPAWSPDGKRIAYVGSDGKSRMGQINVVEADGLNPVRLSEKAGRIAKPTFFPDGIRIAYFTLHEQRGKQETYNLRVHDGVSEKPLVDEIEAFDFAISPDGSRIAIGSTSLKIYDARTGGLLAEAPKKTQEKIYRLIYTDLLWRPDGKAIAYKPKFVGGFTVGPERNANDIVLPGETRVCVTDFSDVAPETQTYEIGRGYVPSLWRDGMHTKFLYGETGEQNPAGQRPTPPTTRLAVFPDAPAPGKVAEPKREASYEQRRESRQNMKLIFLAMLSYESMNKHLPIDSTDAATGKPLLSWRVHLLPFMDQRKLYAKFNLTEPWDSPHNKQFLAELPEVYRVGFEPKGSTDTYYQVFSGPGAVFERGKKASRMTIEDGMANTIAIAEVGPPVPWTKPADVEYDLSKPFPKVVWPFANVIQLYPFSGEDSRPIKPDTGELSLRRMIERNDGQNLNWLALRPDFPTDVAKESEWLTRTRQENAELIAELEDLFKDHVKLMKLRNALHTDSLKVGYYSIEIKSLVEGYRLRVKHERDQLGLRPGAKIPDPNTTAQR